MSTRLSRWYAGLTQWRNWSLPMKLVAVVLVPVVFAVGLGVVQIQRQVHNADTYRNLVDHIETRHRLHPVLTGIQRERSHAVALLSGATADPSELRRNISVVDTRIEKVPSLLGAVRSAGPDAVTQYREVREELAGLRSLRHEVLSSTIEPVIAVRAYNDVVGSLLTLERVVTADADNANLAGTAAALHEATAAAEEMRIQDALVTAALADEWTPRLRTELIRSRGRLQSRLTELHAAATPPQERRFARATAGPEAAAREQRLDALLRTSSGGEESAGDSTGLAAWTRASRSTVGDMTRFRDDLARQLARTAESLTSTASNAAGRDSVILLSALILAAGGMFVITRQLLGSLRTLRRSALKTADRELPQAVAKVRAGEGDEAAVAAVPVDTSEEVGQVARAFDEVNRQALRLAAEQASLHRGYSDSFVGVSRRSQSLLEHQLQLFEGLEQDEEDPDQLARLFQLDHLATRMRRNNENLMVLSGRDLARRFVRPTQVADVLRAAVSEIEQYPRVVVQPPPDLELLGHAASDLVRLLAELLDNAANFSAPETSVTVSSHQAEDGSVIVDVVDEGIGMGDRDIDEANHRLSRVDDNDLAVSRRMGHFVVARLAVRHGISVRLHGGSNVEGLRTSVSIPAAHVASGAAMPPQQAPENQVNDFPRHDLPEPGGFPPAPGQSPEGRPRPSAAEDRGPGVEEPATNLFAPPPDLPRQPRPSTADIGVDRSTAPEQPSPGPQEQPGDGSVPEWFQPTDLEAHRHGGADTSEDEHPRWPGGDVVPGADEDAAPGSTGSSGLTSGGLPRRDAHRSPGIGAREETRTRSSGTGNPAMSELSRETFDAQEPRSRQEVSRRLADLQGGLRFPSHDREGHAPGSPDASGGWSFATDEVGRQAEQAVTRRPTSYTDTGLPRRTPKAHLAPGSASPDDGSGARGRDGDRFRRNPDQVRGRLSDFQSGVRRGRHRAPDEN